MVMSVHSSQRSGRVYHGQQRRRRGGGGGSGGGGGARVRSHADEMVVRSIAEPMPAKRQRQPVTRRGGGGGGGKKQTGSGGGGKSGGVIAEERSEESEGVAVVSASCCVDVQALWKEMELEAQELARAEPRLASSLHASIIGHGSLSSCLSFLLSNKLSSATLLPVHLQALIDEVYDEHDEVTRACFRDLEAVRDRDPACSTYSQCLLFYKGFLAVQAQRVAHCLWEDGRKPLATLLQSRISDVFHVDIHPGARIGAGIFVDHATGVVIGETAVIGENCSLLHGVTLGGSGLGTGVRHPQLGNGVLIGASATVLGNVKLGNGAKIGAGSVVTADVPDGATAVGVPARVLPTRGKKGKEVEAALEMDHQSVYSEWSNYEI